MSPQTSSFNPLPARRPGATILEGLQIQRRLFQSSPSPKAGSYDNYTPWVLFCTCFNPLPARRPGATEGQQPAIWFPVVFQSSPSPKAGSYEIGTYLQTQGIGFNPLPARRPGATEKDLSRLEGVTSFNPLPARRPGATDPDVYNQSDGGFQSSPSPKAGSYWRWGGDGQS